MVSIPQLGHGSFSAKITKMSYQLMLLYTFNALVSVPVQCFENKQLYFAKRLNEAMKVDTIPLTFFISNCDFKKNIHL